MVNGIKIRMLREVNQGSYWKEGDIREGTSAEVVSRRDLKSKSEDRCGQREQ